MCKKLMFLVSFVVLLGPAAMVSAVELKVDVGCPGQEAAGNLKEGWVAFNGTACEGAVDPVTVTDIGSTGIDVTITVGNTSDNAYRSPSGYTGDEMGRDYVSADNSISQAECTMTMTLSNLPEAGYTLTSYHNCPDHPDPKATMDITVSGSGVVGTPTNVSGVAQSNLSQNVMFDEIGKGTVQFVADGAGEVIVTFTAREEAHKWRVYLNGFELIGASLKPQMEFESSASADLETVSPAEVAVILKSPEEGQTYTVDYSATGGTATEGVDYALAGACICDFDGSGQVNFRDLAIFVDNWLSQTPGNVADVSGSGTVDFEDFATLGLEWYDLCGGGTLRFNPGQTAATIAIDIIDDGVAEDN